MQDTILPAEPQTNIRVWQAPATAPAAVPEAQESTYHYVRLVFWFGIVVTLCITAVAMTTMMTGG